MVIYPYMGIMFGRITIYGYNTWSGHILLQRSLSLDTTYMGITYGHIPIYVHNVLSHNHIWVYYISSVASAWTPNHISLDTTYGWGLSLIPNA